MNKLTAFAVPAAFLLMVGCAGSDRSANSPSSTSTTSGTVTSSTPNTAAMTDPDGTARNANGMNNTGINPKSNSTMTTEDRAGVGTTSPGDNTNPREPMNNDRSMRMPGDGGDHGHGPGGPSVGGGGVSGGLGNPRPNSGGGGRGGNGGGPST